MDGKTFFRRVILLWVLGLFTWFLIWNFNDPGDFTTGANAALVTIVGLVTGVYAWWFRADSKKKSCDEK